MIPHLIPSDNERSSEGEEGGRVYAKKGRANKGPATAFEGEEGERAVGDCKVDLCRLIDLGAGHERRRLNRNMFPHFSLSLSSPPNLLAPTDVVISSHINISNLPLPYTSSTLSPFYLNTADFLPSRTGSDADEFLRTGVRDLDAIWRAGWGRGYRSMEVLLVCIGACMSLYKSPAGGLGYLRHSVKHAWGAVTRQATDRVAGRPLKRTFARWSVSVFAELHHFASLP
ncbi:hypothetical protein BDK51DRAFT_43270 [Blyttiomyces helicus]|uniref:Uncharacterized protein n=1 Tax=Blyttiomyces helicus TaxID=388810 RepID=A0A4V1IQC5_9FUNG|nr:hypothetical protein BDK51DRAFT_43270 [Blyttiomyces helicus]|eukprot:RKO86077.1 hypothetical protein BDK51DRAFT_43270 [Blyttiomyces helicus]